MSKAMCPPVFAITNLVIQVLVRQKRPVTNTPGIQICFIALTKFREIF